MEELKEVASGIVIGGSNAANAIEKA